MGWQKKNMNKKNNNKQHVRLRQSGNATWRLVAAAAWSLNLHFGWLLLSQVKRSNENRHTHTREVYYTCVCIYINIYTYTYICMCLHTHPHALIIFLWQLWFFTALPPRSDFCPFDSHHAHPRIHTHTHKRRKICIYLILTCFRQNVAVLVLPDWFK